MPPFGISCCDSSWHVQAVCTAPRQPHPDFADERIINNQPVTVVQGFSETGEKRFEAQVGPDISNLAVNQSEGIIYPPNATAAHVEP